MNELAAQALQELKLPITRAAADMLQICIDRHHIIAPEVAAWIKDTRRQRLEQYEAERRRLGEKQGTGLTRRELTPEGWVVRDSYANANVLGGAEVQPDEVFTPAQEAEAQAELMGHMVEHEVAIITHDLVCFVTARRMLANPENAGQATKLLTVDDLISVQARLHKAAMQAEYKAGVLDGLQIASGKV